MTLSTAAVAVGLLAVMWALQMYLAYRQARTFMAEVRRLRGLGRTAIGVSSHHRWKRRAYVAIAIDDAERVTAAISMSGLTVWARPKPLDRLSGRTLDDLVTDTGSDIAAAASMAATSLRDADAEDTPHPSSEEAVPEEVNHAG